MIKPVYQNYANLLKFPDLGKGKIPSKGRDLENDIRILPDYPRRDFSIQPIKENPIEKNFPDLGKGKIPSKGRDLENDIRILPDYPRRDFSIQPIKENPIEKNFPDLGKGRIINFKI